MTPELETLKAKLRTIWSAGDFSQIARAYTSGAAEFVERLNLQPGMKFIDVACGNGNLAFPAARLGAEVTGVDLAPNIIQRAREMADREGLKIQFDEGDAEALPYPDASFDVVASIFGVMFAPRPELVASELLRICKPGGTIAMGNWTPGSFVGQMFKTTSNHVPPPPGMPAPVLWGVEETVRERFGSGASVKITPRTIKFSFPLSPAEVVEHFIEYYGPTQKAFGTLDESGQAALRAALAKLWADHNELADGATQVTSEYLEVIATRN